MTNTCHEIIHCAIFCSFHSSFLLDSNIILSTLFPKTSVYVSPSIRKTKFQAHTEQANDPHTFGQQNGRQMIWGRKLAEIPWMKSTISFFMNTILVCLYRSTIFAICHTFNRLNADFYIWILSCILFTRPASTQISMQAINTTSVFLSE